MDYNKIIYLLAGIFIVLLIACFAISGTSLFKQGTVVKITSDNTLYDGDYLSVSLTDDKGNPLANQVVNITIIDANGAQNHQQVTTDESGNGMLQLNGLEAGNYNINVVYAGNGKYSDSTTSQNLEIKKTETQSQPQQSSAEPYVVSVSEDGCVLYWSDGHTTYRGETGEPITKEQYEYYKTYGKK